MSDVLLDVRGLRTEIATDASVVTAVDGVSFHVRSGETLGIVGESGCGKSMTANSILRLLPERGRIAAGEIVFDGADLVALPAGGLRAVRGDQIGMVFQDPMTALDPTATVYEQVAEPLRLHRHLGESAIRERVVETLRLVGLPDPEGRLRSYPHQLSGGLRQRVAIAIALVCQPKLLIADEPTTALDVTIQRQILELLDDLRDRLSMAVVLITHDLGVVAQHTDRVAVMYAGKVVEVADTRTMFTGPRHRYTEALFAALPERADSTEQPLHSIPGTPPDLADPPAGCRFAPRCAFASGACTAEEPPLRESGPGHRHACVHPTTAGTLLHAAEVGVRGAPGAVDEERPAAPVVELRNVVKDYRIRGTGPLGSRSASLSATADVSFTVAHAETFGLVGESGCGKSTIARMIAALERPSSGTILVNGDNLATLGRRELRAKRRDVHLMFQDPAASMSRRMRALEILREPFTVQRVGTRAEQNRRIAELLDQVGLARRMADSYPHELSGGQRQRLALARALALNPRVIVADEPVSALDVSIQAQILNLMRDLQAERGMSYVFVSHDLSVIRYMATTIGVMYLGKLVETGPAETVYLRPAHPYTQGLIDSVPTAEVDAPARAAITGDLASAVNPPSGCRFRTRCPVAQDVCAHTEPPLATLPGDRQVACHFPFAGARS